jgi:hypothetical protein
LELWWCVQGLFGRDSPQKERDGGVVVIGLLTCNSPLDNTAVFVFVFVFINNDEMYYGGYMYCMLELDISKPLSGSDRIRYLDN